ncbi:MAG TPA: flagellar motor protein MotB [Bacteroidota bacterium]|nr:flagellar motor protein MotB [Bacteroidota bacterium]
MVAKTGHDTPIIIKKKKSAGHGHHGGAWKVAYADFVTAMMALFIVLWIVGQSKQVRQYVAHYFKDPGAFFENTRGGGMFSGNSLLTTQQNVDENLQRESKRLQEMAQTIMGNLKKDSSLARLMKQLSFELTEEGLRIQLYETAENAYFDIGTARLKPEAVGILTAIAQEVGKLPNKVIIEGHTDSRPYSRLDGYTNFELSADRANAARRLLMTAGVRPDQISEIRGYADRMLRDRNRPFDDSNRRITILIKFEGKSA